jgi:hypothetical protein
MQIIKATSYQIICILLLTLLCNSSSAKIIYVDDDAAGTNDGTSWENAYIHLQDALADANESEKPVEIRVAQGIYRPGEDETISMPDRNARFQISDGVTLAGCYAGLGANDPNARDVQAYETILSGDLLADDNSSGTGDNAYHVVYFNHVSEQTILDGFTITAGNAEDSPVDNGGGIYNNGSGNGRKSNPKIINCTIHGNNARLGGGIFNDGLYGDSSPTLIGCHIIQNSATMGGGMYNRGYDGNSSPFLENCIISHNSSSSSSGGIENNGRAGGRSCPIFVNCIISGNRAERTGGGIYNNGADDGTSSPTLTNCIICGNSTDGMGGGIYNTGENGGENKTILQNCTIIGNYAENGSGICNCGSDPCDAGGCSPILSNCIVWANSSPGEQIFNKLSSPSYSYCDIEGVVSGIGNIDEDPLFAELGYWTDVNDPNVTLNPSDPNAVWIDGDYHLKSQAGRWDSDSESWVKDDVTSPCIDAGDPNTPVGDELFPNGGRINMGAYGGTREASMSQETGGITLPHVAYIYLYKHDTAESFRSLLESYGCPTTLIMSADVTATALDSQDLIIVADDTFYEDAWRDPNAIAAIEDSGKPIVGMGNGGYDFFGKFGLSIGSPHGAGSNYNSISVIDPAHSLFSTPYLIDIPQDGILQLYTQTDDIAIYLWPDIPETVVVFAAESGNIGYYPLLMEHNRYLLWGFTESPEKMTETGKNLFINTVIWMANAGRESEN